MLDPQLESLSYRGMQAVLALEQALGPRLFPGSIRAARRRLAEGLARELQGREASAPQIVERKECLSPAEFHDQYFLRSVPVVLSGAARGWPCTKKWSPDHLARTHGRNDLLLADAVGLTRRDGAPRFEYVSMRELAEDMKAKGGRYLRFSPLLHEEPALAADLDEDWLRRMRRGKPDSRNAYHLFMGGKGQKTLLHSDQPGNLFVQIYGEKLWTLFPAADTPFLYPRLTGSTYISSAVNLDELDLERFPLMRHARRFEARLMPGDVLFVPPHMWHQVENLTDTIAVAHRYTSISAALRSSRLLTILRALATDPPFWKTIQFGKLDTNLVWAHLGGQLQRVLRLKRERAGRGES